MIPVCEWFALCDRESAGTMEAPFGDVPCCQRCAERVDAADRLVRWEDQ